MVEVALAGLRERQPLRTRRRARSIQPRSSRLGLSARQPVAGRRVARAEPALDLPAAAYPAVPALARRGCRVGQERARAVRAPCHRSIVGLLMGGARPGAGPRLSAKSGGKDLLLVSAAGLRSAPGQRAPFAGASSRSSHCSIASRAVAAVAAEAHRSGSAPRATARRPQVFGTPSRPATWSAVSRGPLMPARRSGPAIRPTGSALVLGILAPLTGFDTQPKLAPDGDPGTRALRLGP